MFVVGMARCFSFRIYRRRDYCSLWCRASGNTPQTDAHYGSDRMLQGLMAAYSAVLRGASTVYVVDRVKERLDKAKAIG
jgi:hypothetical protein